MQKDRIELRPIIAKMFVSVIAGAIIPILAAVFVASDIDRGTGGAYGLLAIFIFEYAFLKSIESKLSPPVQSLNALYVALAILMCVVLWFYFDAPSGIKIQRLESILSLVTLAGIAIVNICVCIRSATTEHWNATSKSL